MHRKRLIAAAIGVLVVAVTALVVVFGRPSGSAVNLGWSDEFNGPQGSAPNPAIWTYATGGAGWGNGELECYTDSRLNSALDGHGYLVITARNDPGHQCSDATTNNYTSARLMTANLQSVQYGHIRVRAKLPSAPGTWPAIWALGTDHSVVGWPASGEIDVDEKVGSAPNIANGTLHGPQAGGAPYSIGGTAQESGVPGGTFHVYGVDWTPTSIAFLVDGHVYFTATKAAVEKQGAWVFDKPFYLLLNLAVGGGWPGPPTAATTWPQRMIVDYVRVWL